MSYKGKITTAGSSEAIRFEKDLFKQHPEFKQAAEVKADIIGPGKMLITVLGRAEVENENDPILGAFLSFLERDMCTSPGVISPLDENTLNRARRLTAGVVVVDDELE